MEIPDTATLLRELNRAAQHARWRARSTRDVTVARPAIFVFSQPLQITRPRITFGQTITTGCRARCQGLDPRGASRRYRCTAAIGFSFLSTDTDRPIKSSNPVCCKLFVMERSESNFLFRAYVFANASAAIIGRRLGNLAMGSV